MSRLAQLVRALVLLLPSWVGAAEPASIITILSQKEALAAQLPAVSRLDRLAKGDKTVEWYEVEVRAPSEVRDRVKAANVFTRAGAGSPAARGASRSAMGRGRWGVR